MTHLVFHKKICAYNNWVANLHLVIINYFLELLLKISLKCLWFTYQPKIGDCIFSKSVISTTVSIKIICRNSFAFITGTILWQAAFQALVTVCWNFPFLQIVTWKRFREIKERNKRKMPKLEIWVKMWWEI